MPLIPASLEAYQLLHDGAICMARIEANGLRIDTAYLDQAIKDAKEEIATLEASLKSRREYREWEKLYGTRMNLNSKPQLARVIFGRCGYKRNPFIIYDDLGPKNNEAAFEHLSVPFLNDYFEMGRVKKALSTSLIGIRRETVDGILHPFFNLHTTESYRPSSSMPNLQNQPVRNKKIAKAVRTAIIPRKGNVLIEIDMNSHEVRISGCYNKDPNLKRYVLGGGDLHKDMAKSLFMLSDEELGDFKAKGSPGADVRYCSKNGFVFAQFYGDYYGHCAPRMWNFIARMNLRRADGVSLYDHLKKKGIKKLGDCDPEKDPVKGTFESHVKEVERVMWQEMFPVYDQWKRDWWALYQSQGGVNTLTGFKQEGVFRRNQILCDAVQGSAFHTLLWSLIKIDKEIRKKKMKTKIICQIHDSALFDTPRSEVPDLIEMADRIMVKEVMEHWKWITVPLQTEHEICRENWYDKVPFKGEV